MNEHIELRLGSNPWKPAPNMRMVLELNRYDIPTEGILKQKFRNRRFLFRCIAGATGEYSAWAYVPLLPAEVRSLKTLTGPDLGAYIDKLMAGRTFMMALAGEERGIVHGFEGKMDLSSGKPMISRAAAKTAEKEYAQEAGAIRHLLATC